MCKDKSYANLFKNPEKLEMGNQLVMKFVLPEYVQDVLNGNVYMKQLKFFKELEDGQRGDENEGTWRQKFVNEDTEITSKISYKFIDNIQIASFTLLDKNRDFNKLDDNWYKLKLDVANDLEKIRGGRDAVILNAMDFNQSLYQTHQKSPDFTWSMIEYTDCMQEDVNNDFRMKHIESLIFIKDNFFASQRELRLVKIGPDTEDSIMVKLMGQLRMRRFKGSTLNLKKFKVHNRIFM